MFLFLGIVAMALPNFELTHRLAIPCHIITLHLIINWIQHFHQCVTSIVREKVSSTFKGARNIESVEILYPPQHLVLSFHFIFVISNLSAETESHQ